MGYTGKKPTNVVDVSETQSLTVDDKIGVGTTAPETPVEIRTTNKLGSTFTGTVDGEGLRVTQTNYTSGNFVSLVEAPFDDAQTAANVRIGAMFDGSGSNIVFGTSNSYGSGITNEAMRIVSSGQVCVNTTAGEGNAKLSVVNSSNPAISARNSAGSGASLISFINSTNASFIGSITNASDNSVAYNTTSDYRLKENISLISDAITRVKKLKSYRFNFISSPSTTVDGFLAHEAQEVVPEAVTGTKDQTEAIGDLKDADGNVTESKVVKPDTLQEGYTWTETETRPVYQGIDQSKLAPLLTAALQEAIAKIETLEAQNANFETRLTALEG